MNQIGLNPMDSRVCIRFSDEEREMVETYAARHGMTISEAIRDILERHVKENT